jgi:hypothetical protein
MMKFELLVNFNALLEPIVQRLRDISGFNTIDNSYPAHYKSGATEYVATICFGVEWPDLGERLRAELGAAVSCLCEKFSSSASRLLKIVLIDYGIRVPTDRGVLRILPQLVCTAPISASLLQLLSDIQDADAILAALNKSLIIPPVGGSDKAKFKLSPPTVLGLRFPRETARRR